MKRLAFVALAALVLAGCQDITGNEEPVPDAQYHRRGRPRTKAPKPQFPRRGKRVRQNVDGIGCTLIPGEETRGLGWQIEFHWRDAKAPSGIAGYELFVEKIGAATPLVDGFVGEASRFTVTRCNSFVTAANRKGWRWRVRATDNDGNFGQWSKWASFRFKRCKLGRRTPGSADF